MSISPAGSSRKPLQDEEETLPLYEEHQHSEGEKDDLITPPEEDATPEQVREFLICLLVAERGLALDHCQDIAARWTIGKGQELRSYPPAMYLEIFGREDGWIVYREVKLCIYRGDHKKLGKRDVKTGPLASALLTILALAMEGLFVYGVIYSVTDAGDHYFLGPICGILMVPGFLFCVGVIADLCPSSAKSNDEKWVKKIEEELRKCMESNAAAHK
ncbi:hypothetical protein Q7P37_007154 [Cladosporium fusiforme]